jgi:succinoglycan biosynthesis transport protein ExoP
MDSRSEERSTSELFGVYAGLLLQWSWLLILLALIAGGISYYITNKATRIYQSSSLVMINAAPGSQTDPYVASVYGSYAGTTYSKVMTTEPVLQSVAKQLGYDSFPSTASVQVSPVSSTSLITVTVKDTDPERAALIANTLVSVFSAQIQADQASRYADSKNSISDQMNALDVKIKDVTDQITTLNAQIAETNNQIAAINDDMQKQTAIITSTKLPLPDAETIAAAQSILASDQTQHDQLAVTLSQYQPQLTLLQSTQSQYQQSYNNLFQSYQSILLAEAQASSTIIQKDPAVPHKTPIAPKPTQSALLAAVVGLMIAAGIIFLIEFLDDTIRDPQDITRRWGIPILGMIVTYKSSKGGALITAKHPRSPVSEAFRSLRTNLQFAGVDTPIRTLLITSPSPADGKSTVAANLGSVIAQSGRSVVLVDADLRRPRMHKILDLSNRIGLSDQFIRAQDQFTGSLKSTDVANLHVITSGNLPPNPSELLSSAKMIEILNQLGNQFNTVIVDSPPTLLVTDALVLAPRVDAVLLVIKPSETKWAALRQTIEQLQRVNANLIGVVINDVNISHSRYYYYRGYYRRKYGKGYHYADTDGAELVAETKTSAPDSSAQKPSLLRRATEDKKQE